VGDRKERGWLAQAGGDRVASFSFGPPAGVKAVRLGGVAICILFVYGSVLPWLQQRAAFSLAKFALKPRQAAGLVMVTCRGGTAVVTCLACAAAAWQPTCCCCTVPFMSSSLQCAQQVPACSAAQGQQRALHVQRTHPGCGSLQGVAKSAGRCLYVLLATRAAPAVLLCTARSAGMPATQPPTAAAGRNNHGGQPCTQWGSMRCGRLLAGVLAGAHSNSGDMTGRNARRPSWVGC
jgi:hypothetical protein